MDFDLILIIITGVIYLISFLTKKPKSEDEDIPTRAPTRQQRSDDFNQARRMVEELKRVARERSAPLHEEPRTIGEIPLYRDVDVAEEEDVFEEELFDEPSWSEPFEAVNAQSYESEGRASLDMLEQYEKLLAETQGGQGSQSVVLESARTENFSSNYGRYYGRAFFENRESLKQAIVASELLSPPLALRDRRVF